jgi:hypothetical protein
MPGLDPGIHPSQEHFRRRWIAGSSRLDNDVLTALHDRGRLGKAG